MTAREFDDVGADIARCTSRPVRVDYPIFGADNGGTPHRGWFGQRAGQGPWVSRLGAKMIDGCSRGGLGAVGVKHRPHEVEVDPHRPELLVGLTQSLDPSLGKFRSNHVGLRLPLIEQAESALWNRRAEVHQMPRRTPSRDQRRRGTTQRVTHDHNIVAASVKSSAHHIRVGIAVSRPIVARQLRRDHAVAGLRQERSQLFPAPTAVPRTVDQRKRRHAASLGSAVPRRAETGQRHAGVPRRHHRALV